MTDVSVRPARPEDAERVAGVQLRTWRAAYGFLPSAALDVPPEQAAALWLRAIELPPSAQHRVLVALQADELVGFAASAPEEDGSAVELTALVVEPEWGRRGHGSRLLAATVDHWRGDGSRTATHWAWEQDGVTQAFLAGAGWAPDGTTRGLDTGSGVERQVRLHADVSA